MPTGQASRVFAFPCSTLQAIQIIHVDGLQVAEQHDENGEPDRRLGSGHGKNEKHEYLSRQILQVVRESDEIEIYGEQHQLDRHQNDDQIFPVQENPDDADREQDRA